MFIPLPHIGTPKTYILSPTYTIITLFSQAHTDHLNELKTGAEYKTGSAVKTAKKTIKAASNCNPTGTLPEQWKCPFFHPKYCIKLGHTGC